MSDELLQETVSKLVDQAMQAAVSRSTFTAAWHNPGYWQVTRKEITEEIMVAVILLRPASCSCSTSPPT